MPRLGLNWSPPLWPLTSLNYSHSWRLSSMPSLCPQITSFGGIEVGQNRGSEMVSLCSMCSYCYHCCCCYCYYSAPSPPPIPCDLSQLRCGGRSLPSTLFETRSLCWVGVRSWPSSFWGVSTSPSLCGSTGITDPHPPTQLCLALYGCIKIQNSGPHTQALYPPRNLPIPTVDFWAVFYATLGSGKEWELQRS